MRGLPNIEPSAFRHGQYVGYAAGRVFRISRISGSTGWEACPAEGSADRAPASGVNYLRAATLAAMSVKLAKLHEQG